MSKIKLGIIGSGRIAQVIHLPILSKLNDVELTALCDHDETRAKAVGDKFNIKNSFSDYRKLLDIESINAIHICTSTDSHKEIALAAIDAGKDVFIEKPVARTYDDVKEIVQAAKSKNRKVMAGMNNRFRPDVMLLRSIIESKELGKIYYVKTGWLRKSLQDFFSNKKERNQTSGALLDMGIVMLDLALWMTGYPDVERVNAVNYFLPKNKAEHTSVSLLGMKSGSTFSLEVSEGVFVERELFYCNIHGENGYGKIAPLHVMKKIDDTVVNVTPTKIQSSENIFYRSYENELKHFVGAIKGLHPLISPVDESLIRMKIIEAIVKSSKNGKEVKFK